MKKILALLLALCLLCGMVALAEGNTTYTDQDEEGTTTVSYTVEVNESYTITIPSSIALSDNETSKELKVDLDASDFNNNTSFIVVELQQPSFMLGDAIPYTITDDGEPVTGAYTVLGWTYDADNKTATNTLTITLGEVPTGLAVGEYSDTLTFTATVDSRSK